jgi:hypothetical protein
MELTSLVSLFPEVAKNATSGNREICVNPIDG